MTHGRDYIGQGVLFAKDISRTRNTATDEVMLCGNPSPSNQQSKRKVSDLNQMRSTMTTTPSAATFTPANHSRWHEPKNNGEGVDTTQMVGEDIISLVATFASWRALCTLGCVCRRFAPVAARESLWELRALDIIPSRPQLRSALSELNLSSYRQLVEVFTRIGIPGGVLGFWRADAPVRSWRAQLELSSRLLSSSSMLCGPTAQEIEARGELLRISLADGGFLCESVSPNGTSRGVFTIRVVANNPDRQVKVGFFSMEGGVHSVLGGNGWVPGRSIGEAFLESAEAVPVANGRTPIRASGGSAFFLDRAGGRTCRFTKLEEPSTLSSSSCSEPSASALAAARPRGSGTPEECHQRHAQGEQCQMVPPHKVAQHLNGLWCAPYGSHGLEIIQLSLGSALGAAEAGVQTRPAAEAEAAKASDEASPATEFAFSTSGDSACTSAPATDSSEAGFNCRGVDGAGGWCSSVESDDSDTDERTCEASPSCCSSKSAASSLDSSCHRPMRCEESRNRLASKRRGSTRKDSHNHDDEKSGGGAEPAVPTQLFGVKITGDANVPAGKTSFAIDLDRDCNIDTELEADRRPVILFLPTGAVMANLANRRSNIALWRKGRGQINRVPGRWAPEWVDVDLVVYHEGFRCGFSVVLRQPSQAVSVIMDFEKSLGSKGDWPQWPALSPVTSPGRTPPCDPPRNA